MKKSYIAPVIKVENAELAAFCASGCNINDKELYDFLIADFQNEGECYCYNGVSGIPDFGITYQNS